MKKCVLLCVLALTFFHANAQLDSLKNVWKSDVADSTRYQALIDLVKRQFAVSPDSALWYAGLGIKDSQARKNDFYLGEFYYYKGVALHRKNQFEQSLEAERNGVAHLTKANRHLWAAGLCREMAESYIKLLKYDSAMIALHQGLEINKSEKDQEKSRFMSANIKQTIAYVFELMKDGNSALDWNRQVLNEALAHNFTYFIRTSYFNIGNVYDLLNNYDSSLYYKKKSLLLTESNNDDYLILLGNIGNTYLQLQQVDSALAYTKRFEELSETGKYSQHIKQRQLPRAHLNMGRIYLLMQKSDQAIEYLQKALALARKFNNEKIVMDAMEKLQSAYELAGDYKQSLYYFKLHKAKADSVFSLEKEKVVKDTEARYQNALKQKEITELKNTAQTRQYLIIASVVFSLVLILMLYFYFRGRNNKLRAETAIEKERLQKERFKLMIEAEEKERKRIARELHDGLGQMLSTARLLVSDMDDSNTQPKVAHTLGILDSTIAEVRTISHSMMPVVLQKFGFIEAVKEMVSAINNTQRVTVSLDVRGTVEFSEATSIALYRSLQEIINNALKYARASLISITIEQRPEYVMLQVIDNGKGFDLGVLQESTGIGWGSIYSRVELLGGTLHIDSSPGEGTKVTIQFSSDQSLAISA